jgi:putative membrane protein insertion efficiency factor
MGVLKRLSAVLLLGGIRAYQLVLSPWLGRQCRFEPTCSVYAAEAIQVHGTLRGGLMALRRIGRCHPWGGSGYDPVVTPENDGEPHESH